MLNSTKILEEEIKKLEQTNEKKIRNNLFKIITSIEEYGILIEYITEYGKNCEFIGKLKEQLENLKEFEKRT